MPWFRSLAFLLFSFIHFSCVQIDSTSSSETSFPTISKDYWNNGLAEISVYELTQNRYRETHKGQLISISVQEDFLYKKQVKNERYQSKASTAVLKNIQIRKFTTGIYDYSVFSSTFTPFDRKEFPNSLKLSTSAQEWCGNSNIQINNKDDQFQIELRSYFEKEGDTNFSISKNWLEDELFTLIRMNPELLPEGKAKVIPSMAFIQLQHCEIKAYNVQIIKNDYEDNPESKDLISYKINYPELKREVEIIFSAKEPFKVLAWNDTYPSLFDQKERTTEVRLTSDTIINYWDKNRLADTTLRHFLKVR